MIKVQTHEVASIFNATLTMLREGRQPSCYVLALSGGLDSTVLLHLLATHRDVLSAPLQACYVNHGWHECAVAWGNHCAALCAGLDVPFHSVSLNLAVQSQGGREAQAREARYAVLAGQLPPRGVLLTAHHQDDQAETLLLQLLRGAGLAGLAAMPARKVFADGEHWRPLLDVSRAQLLAYARSHGLTWIDDPSNADTTLQRNALRHTVMPALTDMQPAATANIARSATWLAETQDVLNTLLDEQLRSIGDSLPWQLLAEKPPSAQKALLRRFLQRLNVAPPPARRLQELLRQMRSATYAELEYADVALVFYRNTLHVFDATPLDEAPPFMSQVEWRGVGHLTVCRGLPEGARDLRWSLPPSSARFYAAEATHGKPLKDAFQRVGVPPYLRRRTPALWAGETLLWVGGLGATRAAPTLDIVWQRPRFSGKISAILQASDRTP